VNLIDLVPLGDGQLPAPVLVATGSIAEDVEGSRVLVRGVTVGSPSDLADGLGLMVDDGSGEVRVIVAPDALGAASVPSGTNVIAVGPVGQRDSSGTGLAGYRVHATVVGDFEIVPASTPTPEPTPDATSTPSATAAVTPSPTVPTPVPTPSPAATPASTATPKPSSTPGATATPGPTQAPVIDIVEARGADVGTIVTVAGVVTAEAGRLGIPPVLAIADGTGGIAVRLPDGVAGPPRGAVVRVRGQVADPYGQLELRPSTSGYVVVGNGSLPVAIRLTAAQLGEATEGRLAEIAGTVTAAPRKATSGDITIDLVDAAGTSFRVVADGSSGVGPTDLVKDHAYRLTGIVGQRASRKGALDGYRLYLRDGRDVVGVASSGGAAASPEPSGATGARIVPISTVLAVPHGTRVTIEATVTAGASLLDSSGRRIVVQDRTGAVEVLLPTGSIAPAVGTSVRVTGTTGLAWGAPRLAAAELARSAGSASVDPLALRRAPAERDEWLLVRITGTVSKVSRIGERWRADVTLADGTEVLVQGQAGAGIPSTALAVGRQVTVTGIVRRPYPTASDRRFAVLPRGSADLALRDAGSGDRPDGTADATSGGASAAAAITPDTDLAMLGESVGTRVKVGGLIVRIADNGFDLDDGTALARVELRGDMLALLPHLREGEAVAATGLVQLVDDAPIVVVDADGTLLRVGSLGEGLPIGDGAAATPSEPAGARPVTADSSNGFGGSGPVGLLALASVTALSVLATVARRRLVQRRLRLAVVNRLATLRAQPSADRDSSASVNQAAGEHESA
jgi:hypothetical protein